MTDLFELSLEDSPIPQAMDVYYDQLTALVRSGADQKIALTNNIVDFPMRGDTRLFNAYVARAFADRSISRGSPVDTGEKFLGPANVNDRFSRQFEVLINRGIADVELDLDQEALNKIEESERRVSVYQGQLDDLIDNILDEWDEHKAEHLGGLSEKEIALRQVAWLDIHRMRRRIANIVGKIDRELSKQEMIVERVGDNENSQIYRAYNSLRNSQVALPDNPEIEIESELNEVKMGNPLVVGLNPSWADIAPDLDAIFDYKEFLENDGVRGFSIGRDTETTSFHERKWSASARFRYGWFFSARVNASEHRRVEEALRDVVNIDFGFKRISEVWIRRGDWYDSSLFNLPKIRGILERDKKLAANLRYSVSSLLIARGFRLELSFERNETYEYFYNRQQSGSAKILSIFPAGSGSVNETKTDTRKDDRTKTVIFEDQDTVVRMLGFKVDEMHEVVTDEEVLLRNNLIESDAVKQRIIQSLFNLPEDYVLE